MEQNNQVFRIIHFNDVYDIQESQKQPVGGAARFKTAIDQFKNQNTLVLFSGDAFSPSVITNTYQGKQMIKPLNSFGISVACYGNHDFDIGVDNLINFKQQTNFPWLLSNVFVKETGRRFGEADDYVIKEINGQKIGIFALAQNQWVDVIIVEYVDQIYFVNFIEYAKKMVSKLRQVQKCDFVIALTHMMASNDIKLAQNVRGIDFILGGHDHTIKKIKLNDSLIVKSGANFKNFSVLKVLDKLQNNNQLIELQSKYGVEYNLIEINSRFLPDPILEDYIVPIYRQIEQKLNQIAFYTTVDLDLRFQFIRKQQSPYLNLLADVYRFYLNSDIVILNAGNFRADTIVKPGPVSYGMLTSQIQDYVVTKSVTGEKIYEALQNIISQYPNMAGRFGPVSGVTFQWDPRKQPLKRILKQSIRVNGKEMDFQKEYQVTTHCFHAEGGDGFQSLKNCKATFPKKNGLINTRLVVQSFQAENIKCIEFSKANPEFFRIIQIEGKKLVSIMPDNTIRKVML